MLKEWIPVTEPSIELPKDRVLFVTVDDERYCREHNGDCNYLGDLYVDKLYWDMTEWSNEEIVDYVIAYMDYSYPEPYRP